MEYLQMIRGKEAIGILQLAAAACVITALSGCAEIEADGFYTALPPPRTRVVVWGEHPAAVSATMVWLQEKGLAIVERARLDQVLKEQAIQLTRTRDDQAQILRVGNLTGAELIVFIEATGNSSSKASYIGAYGGIGSVKTVYQLGVSVRAVNLQTSEVLWAGNAHYSEPTEALESGISDLTRLALERAWCAKDAWHLNSCKR
jgi:hypothetical protein